MKISRARRRALFSLLLLSAFVAPTGRAVAAPPPLPWVASDIGDVGAFGSTEVEAPGVWSIRGSGLGIFTIEDAFHYVYQTVRGDASVSARFRRAESGNELEGELDALAGFGLMVRGDRTPGATNLFYAVTPPPRGLLTSFRSQPGRETEDSQGNITPPGTPGFDFHLRLQRVGQEVSGFMSPDGVLWTQAAFPAQVLPRLGNEALLGLAVTSRRYGELVTGIFDQVNLQTGVTSISNLSGSGANASVLLQWRPVGGPLVGYHVYRGVKDATRAQFARLTPAPMPETSFVDATGGLTNGAPMRYAVAPVFRGAGTAVVEGPMVALHVTPVAIPAGWIGTALGAYPVDGTAAFDQSAKIVTVRGAGGGIAGGRGNELYFVSQPVEGDAQITVKLRSQEKGIAGLMIREAMDPIARHACMYVTKGIGTPEKPPADGTLFFSSQTDAAAPILSLPATTTRGNGVSLPVFIRIIRRGNTVDFEYSTDSGLTFHRATASVTFDPPLGRRLHFGLVAASGSRATLNEARFDLPVIEAP